MVFHSNLTSVMRASVDSVFQHPWSMAVKKGSIASCRHELLHRALFWQPMKHLSCTKHALAELLFAALESLFELQHKVAFPGLVHEAGCPTALKFPAGSHKSGNYISLPVPKSRLEVLNLSRLSQPAPQSSLLM